jgi:hypothetical protein
VARILGGYFMSLTNPNVPTNLNSRNHSKSQSKQARERRTKLKTQSKIVWIGVKHKGTTIVSVMLPKFKRNIDVNSFFKISKDLPYGSKVKK